MKYSKDYLINLSEYELLDIYQKASIINKKNILSSLEDDGKLAYIINGLNTIELEQLAKIHPSKEQILDCMLEQIKLCKIKIMPQRNEDFLKFCKAIKAASKKNTIFKRLKNKISKAEQTDYDIIEKKIKKLINEYNHQKRRTKALDSYITRKKIKMKKIYEPTKMHRVDVTASEMTNLYDKCVKQCNVDYEEESENHNQIIEKYGEDGLEEYVHDKIEENYTEILGQDKSDLASLLSEVEVQNLRNGYEFGNPYTPQVVLTATNFSESEERSGKEDVRHWQKNLLEIGKSDNFKIADKNIGKVYIVKSEIGPSRYTMKDRWAPIFEYYKRNSDGTFKLIGDAKLENKYMTAKITLEDGKNIKFDPNNIEKNNEVENINRREIERKIILRAIDQYLNYSIGKNEDREILDIGQIRNEPIEDKYLKEKIGTCNKYLIAYKENNMVYYKLLYINKNGECKSYPEIENDIFSKDKQLHFPDNLHEKFDVDKSTKALEVFKTKNGIRYSVYRNKYNILKLAQRMHYGQNDEYNEPLNVVNILSNAKSRDRKINNEKPNERINYEDKDKPNENYQDEDDR